MSVAELLGRSDVSGSPGDVRRSKYFPGLNIDHLGTSNLDHVDDDDTVIVNDPRLAKPRIDEGHRGMQYGAGDYDRGYPHPRPLHDPFHNDRQDRAEMEGEKMRKQKQDMDLDIQQMKARQMREKQERDEEKKKGSGSNRRRKFLETDFSPRNQEGFKDLKENQGNEFNFRPQGYSNGRMNARRSLDLENTLGGAGAPVKNTDGRKVTRMPITLRRDDYGESKITEDIPGKASFNFDFTEDDNKPYYPWGGQGGGAPIRDREGKVKTMIYGQLEGKNNYSGDFRRAKRRQEVLYNELKEGERQYKQNKEELDRYMRAPQAELADVLAAGRVGKPRRDEITGEISHHHLPNSDVTLVKMNHQPKPVDEKKNYHDELVRMAEERQQLKQLEKLKERQESNAHFRNMDSTWGAFGGGAPKHMQIRKKANLTNSLFYPDLSQDESVPSHSLTLDPQNPPTGLGSFMQESPIDKSSMLNMEPNTMLFASQNNSPRYIKSTINSSHKNMFETTNEQRMMRAQAYNQPLPPYATRGGY